MEKKKEETEKKLTNAINGIRNELHLDTLDAMEREITEEQLKYAELLALANEFELDAITLKKAISEKIAAIQNKYHQKSLEDMKKAQATLDDYLMPDSEKKKAAIIKKYANIWEFATKAGKATPELKQKIDTDKNKELDAVDNENKDILGMTPDEWNILEEKINNIINLAGQLSGIWGQFNQIQNNMDKKELQNFEKNTNKKKELLNKQLNSGRLSQEKYNAQVAQLDADLEKKTNRNSPQASQKG